MTRGPIMAVDAGKAGWPGRTVGTHGAGRAGQTDVALLTIMTRRAGRAGWPRRTGWARGTGET